MSIRNSYLGILSYRVLTRAGLPIVGRFFKTPNQLTFLGLGFALTVPFGFYVDPVFGLSLMVLSGFFDMMDGVMAKAQDNQTRFGALLDSSFDRVSDLCYLMGFWILFWGTGRETPAAVFTFIASVFTFMISYIKARAEGLGGSIKKGLMERGVRLPYLILWALLIALFHNHHETILWIGLILFCVLTLVTVLQRLLEIRLRFVEGDGL